MKPDPFRLFYALRHSPKNGGYTKAISKKTGKENLLKTLLVRVYTLELGTTLVRTGYEPGRSGGRRGTYGKKY